MIHCHMTHCGREAKAAVKPSGPEYGDDVIYLCWTHVLDAMRRQGWIAARALDFDKVGGDRASGKP